MYITVKTVLVIEAIAPKSKNKANIRPNPAVIYKPSVDLNQTFLSKTSGNSPSFANE